MAHFFSWVLGARIWILLATVALLVLSAYSVSHLAVDAVPDITNVQVVVISRTGSLAPEQIEKMVTYPIEQEMSGLAGALEVRSVSKYGLSLVTIVFEDRTPLYFARQLVSEKLQSVVAGMPEGVSTGLAPVSTGLGEILMWTLNLKEGSDRLKQSEIEQLQYLRKVQERMIRPVLKQVDGVAEVDTNGGYSSEVHINYTPQGLQKFGVNVRDLLETVESAGVSYGGGYIRNLDQQVVVRSWKELAGLKEVEDLVIKVLPSGRPVRVRDVAEVRMDHSLRVGAATQEGVETVLGTVLMRIGANSREVAHNARERLEQIVLPEDVNFNVVYSRENLVNRTIQTVQKNLLEGAVLVVVVLLLILGNLRAALMVSLAIPFSMLFAMQGMHFFGISANLMSLGAIDFGLLVDASVVLVENIIRRLGIAGPNLSRDEKKQLFIEAVSEVGKPVIMGLLIIMVVYVPILSLEGVEGKMFEPMALTVLMALGSSLAVALFLIPILAYMFLNPNQVSHKEPYFFRLIQRSYAPVLDRALQFPKLVLGFALALFLVGFFVFTRLGSDFVPQLDEGDLVIGLVRDSRQHIESSVQDQKAAEKVLSQFAEVSHVFSRIGTPDSGTDPMSPNFADTFVILKDRSLWPEVDGRRRTKGELFEVMREELLKLKQNQEISSTQPIEMRFNEILEGSRADVTLRVIGPDLDRLVEYAEQAEELLGPISGVESVEFDALTGLTRTPMLDINLDSSMVAQYGVKLSEVNSQLQTALAGQEVGSFFDEGIRIPVKVHLDEALRDNLDMVKQLPIAVADGASIPLATVATMKLQDQVTTIARFWAQRYSAVSVYLSGRDVSSFVNEAKALVEAQLKLPHGYRTEWGGQFKNLERAQKKLAVVIPITLVVILLMIYRTTLSSYQTFVIFMAVPLGLAGGVFALWFRDIHFSVSAAVGFIALSGIVVLNSLVLVNFVNHLRESGMPLQQAIREGALSRLRPVSMTALVASLGFLPMALNTGLGSEVQRPLATVVIGGLITSTLLTMVVVPVLLKGAWLLPVKQRVDLARCFTGSSQAP